MVVSVADGDTLTVIDDNKKQYRIRLAGIDAPEKGQPYGDLSKKHLSALVFKQRVLVEWQKHDRYGRVVGVVVYGKRDVCLEQVSAGLAWHYKRYASEQSPKDRQAYAVAEDEARVRRVGLWRDAKPEPPWVYRSQIRGKR